MDKPKITPKDFFLWFAAMAFLYVSVYTLVDLIFNYLNYVFPESRNGVVANISDVSYQMAVLVVLFPLFVVLMRVIHRTIEKDSSRRDLWIRRWALYLTLFIAGITLAGDLIALLMYFFGYGDVTLRFCLKVLVLFLVAGGGFLHFFADLGDYWERNPMKARIVGYAAALLVFASIFVGFVILGTPWEARNYRYDVQKVWDLQNIQSQVLENWRVRRVLTPDLASLNNPLMGSYVPVDPQSGEDYEYAIKTPLSFELCATFNADTQPNSFEGRSMPMPMYAPGKVDAETAWKHGPGRTCFLREINPKDYPEFPKAGY